MKVRDFLKNNLKALGVHNGAILQWLASQKAGSQDFRSAIITNSRGLMDWRLSSGAGLFDAISPGMAYKNWIPEEKADTSATLIVGCNLGYGVNHVLANTPASHKVFVLEPRPEMLLACLSQTDFRPFIDSRRLLFVPPDEGFLGKMVWQLDLQYVFGNIFILADVPSHQLGREYAVWVHRCKEIFEHFSTDINTLRINQDTMVGNELKNFARAMRDGSLLPLHNLGRGLSAVVYGAGPSLAKFAPLLEKDPGSVLHVCGLQVLPALRKHGLKPHFCMAIDYTMTMKKVYDLLDKEWAKDIPLIYSCKVAPDVVEAYPGPTLPVWTLGGLGTYMPRDRELILESGGSVTVALTRFLDWCGVRRFLFVGQDFSWQGERTHAAGHHVVRPFRFDPKHHMKMNNKDGETIYSCLAYVTALRDLGKTLETSDLSAYNLNGGGATIKGCKDVTWRQVLEQGLLVSAGGGLEPFLGVLRRLRLPRPWPLFQARSSEWIDSLDSAERRLRLLFENAAVCQEKIHTFFGQILFFLRQDPLYQPYLLNEIVSLAGLTHARRRYGAEELDECSEILKRVGEKVREIDLYLVYNRKAA